MFFSKQACRDYLFFLLVCGAVFIPFVALAVDSPIHIEADRMVSQEQKNSVVFIGNVDAKQDDVIIRTDEMTVFYHPNNQGASSSSVEKLICKGNVEISRANWLGTSNRMDYYADERVVVLTGDAKAWKDQNMVSGKKITYYLDDGRSEVEGPTTTKTGSDQGEEKSGRVQAVIHSNGRVGN